MKLDKTNINPRLYKSLDFWFLIQNDFSYVCFKAKTRMLLTTKSTKFYKFTFAYYCHFDLWRIFCVELFVKMKFMSIENRNEIIYTFLIALMHRCSWINCVWFMIRNCLELFRNINFLNRKTMQKIFHKKFHPTLSFKELIFKV